MSQEPTSPTRLYEIVAVAIRILAIKLALDGLTSLLSAYAIDLPKGRKFLLLFGILVILAYWLWVASSYVARRVTRGLDSSLDVAHLALSDLYSFAFLLVGLYFAVGAVGPSLTWCHYALRQSSSDAELSPEQRANYYVLFKYLVRLLLGVALIFNGRKFAIRLIKHQTKVA